VGTDDVFFEMKSPVDRQGDLAFFVHEIARGDRGEAMVFEGLPAVFVRMPFAFIGRIAFDDRAF
jgi:hypothetical protein